MTDKAMGKKRFDEFRSDVAEAKHPVPPLNQWRRYPAEREHDWNGRPKPLRWFRHDIPVLDDQRDKLRPSGANQPRYQITYNDPESEDIWGKRGEYLGSKRSGNDYTLYYYQLDPVDPQSPYPSWHQELGRFKRPEDAHRAAKAHYYQLHGIERKIRQPKPKPEKPLPDTPRTQYHSDPDDKAESYFNIGHGDDNEPFVVWAQIGGRIQKSKLIRPGNQGTHGSLWGHDITDRDFKGRYEPGTGNLTIVKPRHMEHRELPNDLMHRLYAAFRNITHIHEF